MASSRKRPKANKRQPEVWVAPDLMQRLKGVEGSRGVHVPQSPYLDLADQFLGFTAHESSGSRSVHRPVTAHATHRPKELVEPEPPPRAMVMAAGASAGAAPSPTFTSVPPRTSYPKPPARPAPPRPPKLAMSGLPARPHPPKLNNPKPPKVSFSYRRRKVDRAQ